MPPVTKTYDYLDHRVLIEPKRPGVWRYRVWTLAGKESATHRRTAELVCDKETLTRWNANVRARDVARRRSRSHARWPRRPS